MDMQIGSKSQNYAINIEHKLCNIFNCDRLGIGGMANSDFIRPMPYGTMVATLMFLYKEKDIVSQKKIEKFINDYQFYSDQRIDEIIEKQGEKEFKEMMTEFLNLIK
ncbi:hypothetical protein [Clostridium sp. ZBS4]|uniref:hypothetical protein n=1 Tax=Clostridium sp. ZBS4 TaxID=2949974 RepID=UPI00207A11C1|nr:hypothetical protein [Clostridium sp. ZBS4]